MESWHTLTKKMCQEKKVATIFNTCGSGSMDMYNSIILCEYAHSVPSRISSVTVINNQS